jgi:toxin ParE1/3/4
LKVIWAPSALADLREAADYIATDNPPAARRLILKLRSKVTRLRRFPRLGRVVPERGDDCVRELIEGDRRIVYRITAKGVRIVAVVHARRSRPIDDLPP